MPEFVEVLREEELPAGSGTSVTVAGKDIALFNVDGSIYAIDDSCLHQGSSLGSSKLEGKIVTCRAHGWRYDVTTGSTAHGPCLGGGTYPGKYGNGRMKLGAGRRT